MCLRLRLLLRGSTGLRLCIAWQRLLEPLAESKFSPEDDGTFDIPAEDASRQLERLAESKFPQEKKIQEERIPVAMQFRQVDSLDPYGHARCLAAVREEFAPEAVLQADYTCPGIVKVLVMASYPVHFDGEPMDTPMDTLAGTVDVPANVSMFIWAHDIPEYVKVPATAIRSAVCVMDLHPYSINRSDKGKEMHAACKRACGGKNTFQQVVNRRLKDFEANHAYATHVLAIGGYAREYVTAYINAPDVGSRLTYVGAVMHPSCLVHPYWLVTDMDAYPASDIAMHKFLSVVAPETMADIAENDFKYFRDILEGNRTGIERMKALKVRPPVGKRQK
ncbi:hypothetical protein CYMTET_31242 [Cymbomonas tetramitiformis]|uniref:Uncharacterized protein n=1 Tax=Cymbomonas tetramitiformis TaxID=36881 RepID=A0AAE0FIB1_9CHLO|nr:hypothetical protein CYMTET_31242 [Cymbomonas tetramitiformis]